jgi:hypothetical protein
MLSSTAFLQLKTRCSPGFRDDVCTPADFDTTLPLPFDTAWRLPREISRAAARVP